MKLSIFSALYLVAAHLAAALLMCTPPTLSQNAHLAQDSQTSPLLRFGVLADVQYADKASSGKRAYRDALDKLKACAAELQQEQLDFVLQLGDIIDGNHSVAASRNDLESVLTIMEGIGAPLRHVVGNHCFAVAREPLLARLKLESAYYSFRASGWRFLQLDTLDISVCGREPGTAEHEEATKWLADHKDSGQKNAKNWNGGVGADQLKWIESELRAAEAAGDRVLVSGHLPLLVEASSAWHVLWNGAEVLARLEASPAVVAYFCGHDHAGGYALRKGIHHLTFPGILEAPAEKNAWAVVEVHADHLQVIGHGLVASRRIERDIPGAHK